ncbi:MAG: hypothetical protein LKE85_15210 [Lachnospiraceae bacterium]|jgi:hypothetical protein|nr:hypothetical protein [Lachnospiraceae bacterium]
MTCLVKFFDQNSQAIMASRARNKAEASTQARSGSSAWGCGKGRLRGLQPGSVGKRVQDGSWMLHQKNGGTPGNLSQFQQKKIIWQGHNVEYLLKYIAYIVIWTGISFSILES